MTTQIGEPPWNNQEIKSSIHDFVSFYEQRPISINSGGMMSPHMFATWFMLKKLNPKVVIESGIWKGQGTWLIENTVPKAKVISIDINLNNRRYVSDRVDYYETDFININWNFVKNKSETVLFFDDHQNALNRVKQASKLGFKHLIFEDNYPAQQGDCYSLKKAFLGCGFSQKNSGKGFIDKLKITYSNFRNSIKPNKKDRLYLQKNLDVYYEFPPVYKDLKTRWGDNWDDKNYPTPPPLFNFEHTSLDLSTFKNEAKYYTWICYAKVK